MKKYILLIFLIFIFCNGVYASNSNWVLLKAPNGKEAKLDLTSILVDKHLVKYTIRVLTGNYMHEIKMVSDCRNKMSATTEDKKYEGTKLIYTKNFKQVFQAISPEAIDSVLYYKVCGIASENPLSVDDYLWQTYFDTQQTELNKNWKPKWSKSKNKTFSSYVLFTLDSKGKTVSYVFYSGDKNEKYVNSIKKAIKKTKFDPLPSSYKGKTISFILNFKCERKKGDFKTQKITFGADGVGYLNLVKYRRTLGDKFIAGREAFQQTFIGTLVCFAFDIVMIPFQIISVLVTNEPLY